MEAHATPEQGALMASRKAWSWLVVGLGVLLALVSLFADQLGVGTIAGFGWKQTTGLVVGVALVALAAWRLRC